MIIFSSRKLEQAIAQDSLPNWEKAKYAILPAIISMLLIGPTYIVRPLYGAKPPFLNSIITFLFNVVAAFIIFYGIRKCFRTNEETDRKEFLARYAILSVPVLIKFLLIFIPITFVLIIIIDAMSGTNQETFKGFPVSISILSTLLVYLYYCLLNRSFARLRELIHQDS